MTGDWQDLEKNEAATPSQKWHRGKAIHEALKEGLSYRKINERFFEGRYTRSRMEQFRNQYIWLAEIPQPGPLAKWGWKNWLMRYWSREQARREASDGKVVGIRRK